MRKAEENLLNALREVASSDPEKMDVDERNFLYALHRKAQKRSRLRPWQRNRMAVLGCRVLGPKHDRMVAFNELKR